MIRAYLIVGAAGLVLLAGVASWLVDAGYRRGAADCQATALNTRTEIETRWLRDADQIAQTDQERNDAVAATDAADAGDDTCLRGDSLQPLKAIR